MTSQGQRYQRRLKAGLCPECGRDRDRDTIKCSSCLARHRETDRPTSRENTQRNKRCRDRRRAEGLCPTCGRRRDNTLYIMCNKCRTNHKVINQLSLIRKAKEAVCAR